jgi:hypothetical protein
MRGVGAYIVRMSVRQISVLIATAALLGAAGGAAHADDKAPQRGFDFTVNSEPTSSAPGAAQAMTWDARKGRWGLTLNLEQPETRASTMNDVQAGAYYSLTPKLRVGGAVSLGDQQLVPGPRKITPDDGQPRVRLETKFKF